MQVLPNGRVGDTEIPDGMVTPTNDEESVCENDTHQEHHQPDNESEIITDREETEQQRVVHVAHVANSKAHSQYLRYGIPILLLLTTALLLASDIGSGVVAEYYLYRPDGTLFNSRRLVHVSIFTTVRKLWGTHSYALAIFIACTSVSWPFVKIILSFYAWVTPYTRPRRREMLLEVIDVLGKWSFVDIMVFVEILVAFRSTLALPSNVSLDVYIVPRWGFFGFVLSTMLSLLATQLILHRHRIACYHVEEVSLKNVKQRLASVSNTPVLLVVGALIATSALHLTGCFLDIYRISNTRGKIYQERTYSVVTVGQAVPNSTIESVYAGILWIQYMWFFLVIAMPLWSNIMFAVLYLLPMKRRLCEIVFLLSEISFSWSAVEVLLVSTTFAILQIPAFGNGLVKSGCKSCYVVGSELLPNFAVLVVGTFCHIAVSVWLYRRAHRTLYARSIPTTSSNVIDS